MSAVAIAGMVALALPYKTHVPSTPEAHEFVGTLRHAEAIDAYFTDRKMPLAGYGRAMADAAAKYEIDWRLLPAIAVRESSGGKQACGNNPFGWGSCKKGIGTFESVEEAIDVVAMNLGGWNARTAPFYAGRGTEAKLKAYNPPTIVPNYAAEVMAIMDAIGVE